MEVKEYRKIFLRKQLNRAYNQICIIFVFVVVLFGLSKLTPAQTISNEENNNYKIGVGDVLKILVLKQDLLSQDGIRVSNEGTIRMPKLDAAIPAACLTETQLASEITELYKKYLLKPEVYVTVTEFNAYPVAVIGAVNSSDRFQLQRPMRLLELITRVKGPALNAGQYVQIFRDSNIRQCTQNTTGNIASTDSSQQEIISVSLEELLKGNDEANPYVQGGDIVRVTEAELKQAFVIGNVKSAVTVNLKEPTTLSRAIAMAGGFALGAQLDKIKISRQAPNSLAKTDPIIINLKDKKGGDQVDFLLQPNDIVDVPGPKRSLLKDIIKTIIPAVTRVPVNIP